MKKKEKVEDPIERWTKLEPGGPQDWVWVERNGMRVRPATKKWSDFPFLSEPLLTDAEIGELLEPDREDER